MNRTAQGALIIFSVLLGTILSAGAASSQTRVEGVITSDAKWNADDSPYVLSGEVAVEKGVLLTVTRNVTVIFEPGAKLQIRGRLDAYRVFFNGGRDVANKEALTFPAGSSGRLIRCAFLDLSLVFDTSDMRLSASVISNRNGTGITVGKQAFPQISDSSFHGNSYFALYRKGHAPIEATNCYWGADTGPAGEGHGSGDAVSSRVVYRPFRSKEDINFLILAMTAVETDGDSSDKNIQLTYGVYNLNAFDHEAVLGASLLGPDEWVVNHPSSDIRTTISPGFHEYTRIFRLPPDTRDGIYDVHWSVMKSDLSGYYAYIKQNGLLEVMNTRSRTAKRHLPSAGSDG